MAREKVKNDYIGFTFAGRHTSEFGLYSVSNGDRYLKNLSPNFKDKTAENSGGNGTYYFGSQKTTLQFNVDLAFDDITEEELREIQVWLNSDISELIFDERPYIKYYCKVSAVPQMQYLPFNNTSDDEWLSEIEDNDLTQGGIYGPSGSVGGRVYKGEMSITFSAYEPYGYSVKKWLNEYDDVNKSEWRLASGLLNSQTFTEQITVNGSTSTVERTYDSFFKTQDETYGAYIYNGGNLPSDFIIKLSLSVDAIKSNAEQNGEVISSIPVKLILDRQDMMILDLVLSPKSGQKEIIIDTRKRLIYTIESNGNKIVENNMLIAHDFFKIPSKFKGLLEINGLSDQILLSNENGIILPTIEYNYRYI